MEDNESSACARVCVCAHRVRERRREHRIDGYFLVISRAITHTDEKLMDGVMEVRSMSIELHDRDRDRDRGKWTARSSRMTTCVLVLGCYKYHLKPKTSHLCAWGETHT